MKSFYKGLRLGLFKDVTLVTNPVTMKEAITRAYWAEDMNKSIVESIEANKKKQQQHQTSVGVFWEFVSNVDLSITL